MGKLRTEFTSLIAKSTSPGLSNITFFACLQFAKIKQFLSVPYVVLDINTSEIPGELLRENMISLHMKITCYFFTCEKITVSMAT